MTGLQTPGVADGIQVESLGTRDIVRLMVRIQRMRWAKVRELEELSDAYRVAKRCAVVARAEAFLAHSGPQQERDQVSRLAAADAEFAADAAKCAVDACKEAMSLLKDDWDTCRSINANERAEKNALEGFGT